uniref:Secreted protein n=1 Tax=Elaeophora elaphi TaxID=1147741 RepID=A0A0R3RZ30_9BILA
MIIIWIITLLSPTTTVVQEAINFKANDKTVITLKDLTEAIIERSCLCDGNVEIFKKNDEHLLLLLKISSVRIVSTLQNLAHHLNAEITYLIELSRWKLLEEMSKYFPRLFIQPSVIVSIDELIDSIRNQLFIPTDASPQQMEDEIEKIVQKFFVQLIPPTFLCMTTGPCKSVSQSYANCLQNNSPFWRAFFGMEPDKISVILWQTIMKYRLIEGTVDKLHRLAMEVEVVNNSCMTRHAETKASCASVCIPLKQKAIGSCSEDCKHAMYDCLRAGASDWDNFISVLQKLIVNFDKGFSELEKGVIRSISYAIEMQAPMIAKTVLKKCGRISFAKTSDNTRHIDYQKPDPVQQRAVLTIRQS